MDDRHPPILLHSISSPSQQQEQEPQPSILLSLDDAIEHYLDAKASFPFFQVLIVSCAWIFDAQQSFISVFSDQQPPWHCTHPNDTSCSMTSSLPCSFPKTSWSWDNPKHASMISDWNLECSSTFVKGLPSSAYFAGCIAGGFILSTLSDTRLGRKNMLLLASLTMSISGIISSASPNIWVYAVLRFIAGFGRSTIASSSLVLATEMICKRWRGEVGAVCYIFFSLGFLSLPLMAYFTRESSWRNLYLFISIPSLFYTILLYFSVPESPRWLFVHGRTKEAIQILEKNIGSAKNDSMIINLDLVANKETCNMGIYSSLEMIWERKWAFWRMLTLVILGFGCGVAYYGMSLGVGTLGVNLYLSISFNALVEIPAALIIFFLFGKMKRKTSLVVFCMASAVCSVLCVFLKMRSVRTAVEVVAFFATVIAFNVLLIYCMELFPTCLRNTAMSFTRQTVAFGSCIVPIMVAAGREQEFWSYGAFGFIIGGCGLFALYLPETKGKPNCDTLEEQEIMEKEFLSIS